MTLTQTLGLAVEQLCSTNAIDTLLSSFLQPTSHAAPSHV